MEFFYSTELAVPISQITLLLVFSTLALLFGRVKLALIINYVFTLYWGYGFNREQLMGSGIEKIDYFTLFYFGFGLLTVILALIGFMIHDD
ncbi:MAG: hypothetical protein JRJ69_00590 [Deltaproteobacteria bacterium]|nr:hypothetical protein [Deltaproteobacteria bacterium]MBW1736063.1 hypothetical protein [Deltaproteobacteria bacterium]MBW1908097.1 hypothetical protein [Deltaproteobacteria bacterium]MBW2032162.1 hypothetical protein [Deltaproteobacteria bacterium]MBW2113246.1 hypothetical protein [Deltaproteobacteria bacterium]